MSLTGKTLADPVDFVVVTILDVELEAVLRHFPGLTPQEFVDDPLVYYCGRLAVGRDWVAPGYSIVVVQLLAMGNPSAAVAVTKVLEHFQPRAILVVGIAGGVSEEVSLGDVALSREIVNYESGKQFVDRFEHRSPTIKADPVLANKAKLFGESDWHARILAVRPDETGVPAISAVTAGTIASGEKVVDSKAFIEQLKTDYPKLIAVAMEGSGVALPASYFGVTAGGVLEIRGISDLADGSKDDRWQPFAADAAAAFAAAFLATGPTSSHAARENARHAATTRPYIMIRAQSMAAINSTLLSEALTRSGATAITDALIDLMPFAGAIGKLLDRSAATREIVAQDGALSRAVAASGVEALAFAGHLHVPLAVLAGSFVTDRVSVDLYDFHRSVTPASWSWPATDDVPYPAMQLTTTLGDLGSVDALARVSVSYRVDAQLTEVVVPHARVTHVLTLPDPMIDVVKSAAQARAYARQVRESLDQITALRPRVERIHLFYAGPVSVAFGIGQAITQTIHPPVVAWNYRGGAYDWGLDIARALDGGDAVVGITDFRSEGGS